jgi:hypothetical protein
MRRDNSFNQVIESHVYGPIVAAADNTPATIDLVDADSATLLIAVGIGGITFDGTNKIEFKVTHSDDDSTYTAVGADDVVLNTNADTSVGSGGIVKSLIAAHAAADVSKVGYIGGKRYIKVLNDFSGTHGTGTPIAVMVVKSRLHQAGVA